MMEMKLIKLFFIGLALNLLLNIELLNAKTHSHDTLTKDGAWCWFADPRAIYYKGEREQTYFSWVTKEGDIEVAGYNHKTGVFLKNTLYYRLQVDDHDNPSIYIREDGRIVVFFSMHTSGPMHRMISDNPEDITSFGEDYTFGTDVTYPYPFKSGNELLFFYRGINWHPTLVVSADSGKTFGTPQQFVSGGGSRPYTRYCSDQEENIHIAFTTGHPRNEPSNKIYYARYKAGKFYSADGTFIKNYTDGSTALDIDNNEAETVYDASNGKGWIWDITTDENGYPVMVYAVFPNDQDHRYYYSRWTGLEWYTTELTQGGPWFPQTPAGDNEPEPNYSGGISLDYDNPNVVYLSKPVDGVFEIWKWTTSDNGHTWDSIAITSNTPEGILNVRPIVPRHHKQGFFDVLWMRGTYVHYTNYSTAVLYQSNREKETIFDFGTVDSPLEQGAIKVTDTELFLDDFGFSDTTDIGSTNSETGDTLQRDFVFGSSPKKFKISALNGLYLLTVLQGDAGQDLDKMYISVNGDTVLSDINITSGNWVENSFEFLATEGSIEVEFGDNGGIDTNWVVNAIKLETTHIFADSIILSSDSVSLIIGEEYQLQVQLFPFLTNKNNIKWHLENPNVADVQNGKINALAAGSTVVRASADSGKVTDSCIVFVREPVYLDSAYFDFGTTSSLLDDGAIRVSDQTILGDSYGWTTFSGLVMRDRSTSNRELRDLIFSPNPATFRVYLKNGTYPVIIKQGDASYPHDNIRIEANGEVVGSSIGNAAGQYITTKFNVTIDNGILELTFFDDGGSDDNWVVNSIRIGISEKEEPINIETLKDTDKIGRYASFQIVDITGKIICRDKWSSKEDFYRLFYHDLPNGIYLLNISNEGINNTVKFIKESY